MSTPCRCKWCEKDPLYIKYHDTEWGVPVHDDQKLFECEFSPKHSPDRKFINCWTNPSSTLIIALFDWADANPCWFRKTRLDTPMNLPFDKIAPMNLSMQIFLIALATSVAACASHRIENEPTDNGVQTNKVYLSENPEDQLICRKEKVMGSNLRKRVCYKKRDLDAKSQMDKEDYREMQTRAIRPTANQ